MNAAFEAFDERKSQRLQNVVTAAGAVGGAAFGAMVGAAANALYARKTRASSVHIAALQGSMTGLVLGGILGGLRGRVIGTLAAITQELHAAGSGQARRTHR